MGYGREIRHRIDDIRLNPDTSEGGRDNFDISRGDKVRENLLDGIRHSQSRRLDRDTGGGDSEGQSLSVSDVESLGLDIGHGHGVVDRSWDGLKLSKVKTMTNLIRGVKVYLGVSDGEDLGLDRVVGDCYSRRRRAILAGTRDQTSANTNWSITQQKVGPYGKVHLLWAVLVNDNRSLITAPTVVVPPLEKRKSNQQKFHNTRSICSLNGRFRRTQLSGVHFPSDPFV